VGSRAVTQFISLQRFPHSRIEGFVCSYVLLLPLLVLADRLDVPRTGFWIGARLEISAATRYPDKSRFVIDLETHIRQELTLRHTTTISSYIPQSYNHYSY
jgi:hypothetical protein